MDDATKKYLPGFVSRSVDAIQNEERVSKVTGMVDRTVKMMVKKDYETGNDVTDAARGPIRAGLWVMFALFGVFGFWAGCAPLQSAAVAPGSIVLDSNKKVIQHLEGGIIADILVKDGDFVQADQVLIRLDETSAKARFDILVSQVRTLRANEIRLLSEREGRETVEYNDPWLADKTNPEVNTILTTQTQLFESRRKALAGQVEVLEQRIKQSGDEINGLIAQENAARNQIEYLNDETKTVKALVEKGQALRPRLLALQRNASELQGRKGELQAMISRAKQNITQSEVEILNAKNQYRNEVERELRDVQAQVADFSERLKAAEDVKNRLDIIAPQSGIVSNLVFHTKGGVIPPGSAVMEIVPKDDKLIVEARVALNDIDVVHADLPARVRLSAFKARRVPVLDGKVINVSADRIVDKNTGAAYYNARVEIDQDEIDNHLSEKVELYPGMPAEVLIVTGSRTMLAYLFSPFGDSMFHAFREE